MVSSINHTFTMKYTKHTSQSFVDEAKKQAKRLKASPPLLTSKNTTKYTKQQLEEMIALRGLQFNILLNSARRDDMSAVLVLPTADQFEIPLSRVSSSLEARVELLDIYRYLESRKENLSFTLSTRTFGAALGVKLPKSTCGDMLKREDEVCSHKRLLRTVSI
jgi:hypothetical protein